MDVLMKLKHGILPIVVNVSGYRFPEMDRTVRFVLYDAYFMIRTVRFILYNAYRKIRTVLCDRTIRTVQCVPYDSNCTMRTV